MSSVNEQIIIIKSILNNKNINRGSKLVFSKIATTHGLHSRPSLSRFNEKRVKRACEKLHSFLDKKVTFLNTQEIDPKYRYTSEEKQKFKKILDKSVKNINLYVTRQILEKHRITKLNRAVQAFTNDPNGFLGTYANQNSNFVNEIVTTLSMDRAMNNNKNKLINNIKELIILYHPYIKNGS